MGVLDNRSATEMLLGLVLEVLDVHTYKIKDHGKTVVFTGRLRQPSSQAFERLQQYLRPHGYQAMLRQENREDVVIATPALPEASRSRPWLNLLLFACTVVTTLIAGAFIEGRNPLVSLDGLLAGVPFSVAILSILGAHELGHYFVARHYKMEVSLPYFVPFIPFFPLGIGTMGAVIRMRSPMTSRKALFDIGLAGPIAGLLVAIPVLAIGLYQSELVSTYSIHFGTVILGKPLLYKAVLYLVRGPLPESTRLALNSVAFAGWVGLFVTALNLLPAGQLDGGHIAYAVWGRAHSYLAKTTFLGLMVMGLGPLVLNLIPGVEPIPGWSGWLIWALLLSAFGLRHPPVLDDITPLSTPRRIIGLLSIALMLVLITPVPFSLQ